MVVYLATTVFGHLYSKRGCTAADVAALRKAVYGRHVSIPLGLHNLEEILLAPGSAPQALAAQIRLLLSLSSSRMLVKSSEQILLDDVRSFAASGQSLSPLLRGETQNAVSAGIAELLESDGEELGEEFVSVLEEARRQKESLLAEMQRLVQSGEIAPTLAADADFDEHFRRTAPVIARSLANRAGVADDCKRRGIESLLAVRSVRIWTGGLAMLAQLQNGEGRASRSDDLAGLIHAVAGAAAADGFVCGEPRLAASLSRVGLEDFRIMELRDFVASAVASPG
jgi:hypothetical protein